MPLHLISSLMTSIAPVDAEKSNDEDIEPVPNSLPTDITDDQRPSV